MPSLVEALTDDAKRQAVVQDCIVVLDEEVADKSGLSGMAIKGGYKAVKGVKPGFIPKVVNDLLPEFARAVDPIYQEAKANGSSVSSYFVANASRVADALLAITDAKAAKAKSGVAKSAYDKLRGSAKKNVEQAVPRLGELIEKYGN